jgi:hypothetical protein
MFEMPFRFHEELLEIENPQKRAEKALLMVKVAAGTRHKILATHDS